MTTKTKKVATEVAQLMLEQWFELKRIKDFKREQNSGSESVLLQAVCDGNLSFNKDSGELTQILNIPIGEKEMTTDKLVFFPRLKVKELNIKLKGIKGDDADGRILAYAAALTSNNKGIIENLDIEDYSITQSIVVYFL